jgi:RNA polymerase sigma-70 factor (ECF subfamily)
MISHPIRIARTLAMVLTVALTHNASAAEAAPQVVTTQPAIGVADVDPTLTEIRVVFDQEMAGGFSWTGGGDAFPQTRDKPHWEADKKTCVLPVILAPGKFYRVGINSSSARNFKSESGVAAEFNVIYFTTTGADPATSEKLAVPKVVSMSPADGATDVAPDTTEMTVTFDRPMAQGFSWTKVEGTQPQGSGKPWWNADQTVCTLPVTLEPGKSYSIGLNHAFANNFQSAHGVPLTPIVWTFTTSGS